MCSAVDFSAVPARIWRRMVLDEAGCWNWPGATGGGPTHRYGIAHFEPGDRLRLVHREVYIRTVGPVTDGEHVHHVCGNTLCANPLHLKALTIAEHIGQWNRDKTHCPHGHPYDEANTQVRRDGWRACRACARERAARNRAKRKAAA